MSRIVQFYKDNNKTIKDYPKTLAKAVYNEDGTRLKDTMDTLVESMDELDEKVDEIVGLQIPQEYLEESVDNYLEEHESEIFSSIETKGAETLASIPSDYTTLSNDVTDLKEDLDELESKKFLELTWVENKYIHINAGNESSSTGYACTEFVAIPNDWGKINVLTSMFQDVSCCAFYTSTKSFISGVNLPSNDIKNNSVLVPSGSAFVRFTCKKALYPNAKLYHQFNFEDVDNDIDSLESNVSDIQAEMSFVSNRFSISAMFSKVLFIGDSLTQGAYYGTPYISKIGKNFPNMFCRMGNIGGNNEGYSGITPIEWYANKKKSDYKYWDLVVLWLGTNDGLTDTLATDVNSHSNYNEYANTNTGCYCKIIESIKESNPSANIVMLNCYATSGNITATRKVLGQIAEKYNLPLYETEWLSLSNDTSYSYHAGVNNVHLGVFGAWTLAQKLWTFIYDYYKTHWINLENGDSSNINPTNWTYINR